MTEAPRLRAIVASDVAARRTRIAAALETDQSIGPVGLAMLAEVAALRVDARAQVLVLDVSELSPALALVAQIMSSEAVAILALSPRALGGEAHAALLAAGVVDVLEREALEEEGGDALLARATRLVARIPVVTRRRAPHFAEPATADARPRADRVREPVVAIGASTGGPAAVAEILSGLPASFSLPILVVVHVGIHFGYSFAQWLGTTSRLPVHQAKDQDRVLGGHVYVAPPERHLVLHGDRLLLTQDPERHSCRPSVDTLFESVAAERGPRAIGCLLTGIGKDGAAGLLAMRRAGATTVAQDESSCAVFGMPREAIALGAASRVASPREMVSLLVSGAFALSSHADAPNQNPS